MGRYFIGYNLEGEDARLVDALRHSIADKFGVQGALKLPPHLTIFPPFEIPDGQVGDLQDVLKVRAEKQLPFELQVMGFNHFDRAVWFIDVEQSQDLFGLKKLLDKLLLDRLAIVDDRAQTRGTHFHITLAYKDVTPEKFERIGEYLRGQKVPVERLSVGAITLFKYNGEFWEAAGSFKFANNS
jgi:2'-5' RNA ligase